MDQMEMDIFEFDTSELWILKVTLTDQIVVMKYLEVNVN